MIKGIEVEIGGTVYTVPPLSLGAIERFEGKLARPTSSDIIDIALAALGRNYADLTRDKVADIIDVENCGRVFEAIMGVSSLVPKVGESSVATRKRRMIGG